MGTLGRACTAAAVLASVACAPPENPQPTTTICACDFSIKSVNPSVVDIDGTDRVTVVFDGACAQPRITVRGVDIDPQQVTEHDANTLEFTAPAEPDITTQTVVPLTVNCGRVTTFGRSSADASLTFMPCAHGPTIVSAAPVDIAGGPCAPTTARMDVTFSCAIDPATVTKDSFAISEITGLLSNDGDFRTFHDTPDHLLDPCRQYTSKVTTAVQSQLTHKPLRIAPQNGGTNEAFDEWTFTTCCN
jgi:hypothetical protein